MSRRTPLRTPAKVALGALVGALVAVLAHVGLAAPAPGGTASVVEYPVGERRPAPAVRGELLGGGRYDLADRRGEVVVINFWASWCPPCRVEAADLERTYLASRAAGVAFLGVNTRDDRDKAEVFMAGRSSYPSLFDPAGRVALAFTEVPPTALPATLIVDRQGRIAAVIRVPVRQSDLQPLVERVAAEVAAP